MAIDTHLNQLMSTFDLRSDNGYFWLKGNLHSHTTNSDGKPSPQERLDGYVEQGLPSEWGPGDMGMSFGHADSHDPPYPPEMENARQLVKGACDRAGVAFLSSWNDPSLDTEGRVRFLMDWGVRIIAGGGEEGARIGREISGRTMPV